MRKKRAETWAGEMLSSHEHFLCNHEDGVLLPAPTSQARYCEHNYSHGSKEEQGPDNC